MALIESVTRLISRILSIAHTRIALAGVEIEEEMLRYANYFIRALAIFFCATLAVLLGILLILALCWDQHRIAAVLGLCGFFSLMTIVLSWRLRRSLQNKPGFLQYTLAELQKDAATLRGEAPGVASEHTVTASDSQT